MPRTLTARLAWLVSLLVTLAIGGVGCYAYFTLQAQLEAKDERTVEGKLGQIRHLVAETPVTEGLAADRHRFEDVVRGHRGLSVRLVTPQWQTYVFGDVAAGPDSPVAPMSASGDARSADRQTLRIEVLQHGAERAEVLRQFRYWLIGGALGGALLAILAGAYVTRRELRPIHRLVEQVHKIDVENLDYRVHVPGTPTEMVAMATAFNQMLTRVESGYERLARFSADLAHDIRTPLNNLVGHAEVVLSRTRPAEEYARVIEDSLHEYGRLNRMVEAMLFLARADNAAIALRHVRLDAAAELQKIADYFDGLADERGLTFEVHASGWLTADPMLFQRCIGNVVLNAIQHADPDSVIRLEGCACQASYRIRIVNTGTPIAAGECERIFERFYRVDTARANSIRSTGLGLAIVRSIMHLHHGTVHAMAAGSRSTRFELVFPHAARTDALERANRRNTQANAPA
ncbi:heavy metal sensor histidine kinase [Imbroritus primus]|uniref:heavy metal sensor histidine kinase n=1 Tax=Imbroritus primus TaxID=3058603 RepID=UPI0002696B7F